MPTKIERHSSVGGPLTVTTSPSALVPYGASGAGLVFVDAVSSATTLAWYVATGPEGTPYRLRDGSTDVTTPIAAGKAVAVPAAALAAPFLSIAVDAGTATVTFAVKG